jgi:hypothetical protein
MSKQQWPVDFEQLHKDTQVSQQSIESALGFTAHDKPPEYAYALLVLCEEIRRARPDLSGHVRADKLSVRIMTDVEADDWQDKRHRETIDSLKRIGKRRKSIDRSAFSANRQAKCESLDVALSATIIVARSESRRHRRLLAATERRQAED